MWCPDRAQEPFDPIFAPQMWSPTRVSKYGRRSDSVSKTRAHHSAVAQRHALKQLIDYGGDLRFVVLPLRTTTCSRDKKENDDQTTHVYNNESELASSLLNQAGYANMRNSC
jgi:hypothetical protein